MTDVPEILLVYFRYKYDDGSSDNAWISYHEFLYYCKHREVLDAWPYEREDSTLLKKNYNAYPFERIRWRVTEERRKDHVDTAPAASKKQKVYCACTHCSTGTQGD